MSTRGRLLLAQWIAQDPKKRTQTAIAKAIATMQSRVSDWLAGRSEPGAMLRDALEILTEGHVPAGSWHTAKARKRLSEVQPMKRTGT